MLRNIKRFSKPTTSFLLHVFAKNSGHISGRELDEVEKALDGELTRRQITNWFSHQRLREFQKSDKFLSRTLN